MDRTKTNGLGWRPKTGRWGMLGGVALAVVAAALLVAQIPHQRPERMAAPAPQKVIEDWRGNSAGFTDR